MLKKIKIKINGIHCKSCKTLIETDIDVLEGVKDIDVDHQTGNCQIEFDDHKIS
ncbi:heavy-metal-associated domain-containing protein [Patescibacteria group bacterium]|nr:heavy-metal-associated domain-containing protein [Patescibacteria group bacterium]